MKTLFLFISFFLILSCSESISTSSNSEDLHSVSSDLMENPENATGNLTTETHLIIEQKSDNINAETPVENEPAEKTEEVTDEAQIAIKKIDEKLTVNALEASDHVSESITQNNEAPISTAVPLKPSHEKWDALLKKNVSSSGKVNYGGMKAGLVQLESYITYLESFSNHEAWTRNEKLAYWINLYNAATVRLIVENYPVASITDLSGGKPWDQSIVKVGMKNYTLNDIENNIIRPRFKDARIHFAVNCAAKSCPPIMNSAFTPSSLNRQLEKQTKAFINGSENSISADKITISKIFDWYKIDFENGNIIAFLNKYSEVQISENASISYNEYNWALNK